MGKLVFLYEFCIGEDIIELNPCCFSVVVLGGDGSVSKVVNLLIELTIQRDENFDVRENSIESLRDKLKTPLCIIPTGSTNIIANSIYGTTDYNTPLMHLFYGTNIRIYR